MKDLFGEQEPMLPRKVKQLVRKSDPVTSRQAAEAIIKDLRELQAFVYEQLRFAGREGLTDLELEEACGSHGSTFRTRRTELTQKGLVIDTGRKKMQKGGWRIVWACQEFYL